MRIRSLVLGTLISACALALTSACGSSSSKKGSGGTGGTAGAGGSGGSGSGDCNSVATSICNKLNQCSPLVIKLTYGDVPTCVTRAAMSCASGTTASGASVTPAELGACADAYSKLDCADLMRGINTPSECKVTGTLANGTTCGADAQCKSGYCSVKTGICGACADQVGAGKTCTTSNGCTSGLICNSSGVCATPVKAGGTCTSSLDCAAGLVCPTGSKTCTAPVAAGQACTGGDCDQLAGAFCNPQTNVCETIQVVAAGQPCGLVSGAVVGCSGGGHCNIPTGSTQGTCQAPAADGAACDAQKGPTCLQPALCVNGQCTLSNPKNCN